MKRIVSLFLMLALLCACIPALADDGYTGYFGSYSGSTLLSNLTHNCPNTGIMLPDQFSPYQTTYLLTVASWVSSPTFTPTAMDPTAKITVNGQTVQSGQKSQVISMSNKPQAVSIVVSNGGASTTYTIYLQRRPSEKRTRVSYGYINKIYQKGTKWRIDADLVSVKFNSDAYEIGNLSTFSNKEVEHYDYEVSPNCSFYYGPKAHCYRAQTIFDFMNNYMVYSDNLYTIVYIEDVIEAVFPYGADY